MLELNYIEGLVNARLNLERGINFVSFDKLPERIDSCELIEEISNYTTGMGVTQIARFRSGRFEVTSYRKDKGTPVSGECFAIMPGEGYVIRSDKRYEINLKGYELDGRAPVQLSTGWNLIGINGEEREYTAQSLIEEINSRVVGVRLDNVSDWRTERSSYQGLQMELGEEGTYDIYGFDYVISPSKGYFVRNRGDRGVWSSEGIE